MTNKNDAIEKPWFKHKWFWLVISLPLLTVVAGVVTFQIANDNKHSMIQDDYFKQGLAINQSLAKQQKAKQLGISFELTIDQQSQLLLAVLHSQNQADQVINDDTLALFFYHPTLEDQDVKVMFNQLSDTEFAAQIPQLVQAYWHISLENTAQQWQLKSRWHFPSSSSLKLGQ